MENRATATSKDGSLSSPDYFGIEVTRRCNLRCPHCFTDSGGSAHKGQDSQALCDLLTQLASAGARTIAFSGGEPLLRRDLEQVMAHGRDVGIQRYTLVTNGFYAEPATVTHLKEAGLESVQVSLDGVDCGDHCTVRRCSAFDFYRALRAIRVFQEAGVVVDVACVISPTSVERAAEMALLCEALQVRFLRYCGFVPTGRAAAPRVADRFRVDPNELDRFFELLRAVDEGDAPSIRAVTDHSMGPWRSHGDFHCDAGLGVAYISAEGDLYPCPSTIFEELVVGNVFQTPLERLLRSPGLARVRAISRRQLAEPCASCANIRCSGGCRGAARARGNLCGAPFYCNLIRRMDEK